MTYPTEIMNDVVWSFIGGKYETLENFIKAVNAYHVRLNVKQWNPYETAINDKQIGIQFSYWNEEEDDEIEEYFGLTSDTIVFSNAELLFKIHNTVVGKLKNEDNHFFEGLILWEGENPSQPNVPLYFVSQGS